MAVKAKAASDGVTVPRSVLAQFVKLVEGLEAADAAYKSCQSSLFRSYAQSAYKAANTQAAVNEARRALG